jgi:molybdopterin-dependent oxidoreductase alpha subunit
LLILIGSNLANNQPVTMKYLHYAKKAGTRVVVVNPFREPALERYWVPSVFRSALFGTRIADDHYAVRPGGDIAFMSGILKVLDQIGGWDEQFVSERTRGAAELRGYLKTLELADLAREAGVEEERFRQFAELYARAKTAVIVYSMGLTQYDFGVENVKMVVNLALARGMIGRRKCGIMPIRGHSGVQGSAECGADPDKLPGGVPLDAENIQRFERGYAHPIPARPGLRAAELLDRSGEAGLGLLYLIGGNHLETMPDREHAARALSRVGLRVHQDIVLNTSTLLEAEDAVLVLPAQTRYEQKSGGTSTSTERRIRYTPEIPGPRIAEARAEWEILSQVGRALRPERTDLFAYEDTGAIRREMNDLMPIYRGIDALEREGDSLQWGGPVLGSDGFPTADGRAQFTTIAPPRVDVPLGRFLLTSRRGKQFNSMIQADTDALLRGAERDAILIDARDLADLGIGEGERVLVSSDHGRMEGVARAAPCRRGHVQAYWPECNVLVPRRYDPSSGEPDYSAAVRVERAP